MNIQIRKFTILPLIALCLGLSVGTSAQETPPKPATPKSVNIPAVQEKKLSNGLTVAVVEKKGVPLVTAHLMVRSGAELESLEKAGLANLTASVLTKGTKTRSATQIAEEMEFLGATVNSGAGWNNSTVSVTVTSDKLEQAMAILADVALDPAFKQEEIDLAKSQTADGLAYNLRQPGFLANYVTSKYSFGEHPAGGTPASIDSINRADIAAFYAENYRPSNSVLLFAGDISIDRAARLAESLFGGWKNSGPADKSSASEKAASTAGNRFLVVDLPESGQAAVTYTKRLDTGRVDCATANGKVNCTVGSSYYPATVLNSLLGGGYSSRLNQEIRIKRGLSYGAGSSFAWRDDRGNFFTRTQTKNESAPEVVELVLHEVRRLSAEEIPAPELDPRKAVLTGGFGRSLETTAGLANALAELYSFDLSGAELNSYMARVNAVTDAQIREFAKTNLLGGDVVIVGDYAKFKDDLAKRFPEAKVTVIRADELDLTAEDLRKVK